VGDESEGETDTIEKERKRRRLFLKPFHVGDGEE